jgi:hypothetical protein
MSNQYITVSFKHAPQPQCVIDVMNDTLVEQGFWHFGSGGRNGFWFHYDYHGPCDKSLSACRAVQQVLREQHLQHGEYTVQVETTSDDVSNEHADRK